MCPCPSSTFGSLKVTLPWMSLIFLALVGGVLTDLEDSAGELSYKNMSKPFRMSKVNLIWDKAKHRLNEAKLKSLYGQLLLQDKDEIQLKRVKSEGQDKAGDLEAKVRSKFRGILDAYGLSDMFGHDLGSRGPQEEVGVVENALNKNLFRDKKLNKLWEKAERGGFNEKELKILKEEFDHHQHRLDEYYITLESIQGQGGGVSSKEEEEFRNEIDHMDLMDKSTLPLPKDKKMDTDKNHLKQKYKGLKRDFEELSKKATSGPSSGSSGSFTEPRVDHLWRMALEGDFTPEDLSSLREELRHYEKRIQKLDHFQRELRLKADILGEESKVVEVKDSPFMDKVKGHERVVQKMDHDLEDKILRRSRHRAQEL